jgi:hypothetical protein
LDELVQTIFHEIANIYLGHFTHKRKISATRAKFEIEATELEDKWFAEYQNNRGEAGDKL